MKEIDWIWAAIVVLFVMGTYIGEASDKQRDRIKKLEDRLDKVERSQDRTEQVRTPPASQFVSRYDAVERQKERTRKFLEEREQKHQANEAND